MSVLSRYCASCCAKDVSAAVKLQILDSLNLFSSGPMLKVLLAIRPDL